MKIGIDIRVLMDKQYSGISEYTANLLAAILRQDKSSDYRLFYNSGKDLSSKLEKWHGDNSRLVGMHIPNKLFNYLLQKILRWPRLDQVLGGVDLFWSPHFNFTSLSGVKSGLKKIITVHDLSFLRYGEFFSWRKNFWHRALRIKQSLREATMIVAVSENTKNDLVELVGIPADKIRVIYAGNNIEVRTIKQEEQADFLRRHQFQGRFILYLGNIEPRKNIAGLIAAYDNLRRSDELGKRRLGDLKLILAGANGWKNRQIYQAWNNSPYRADIKFLGYVNQTDREILYSLASVFAYPSFYEGFGFPPLEALSYGLPVVCSNISSLPEIVGRAALTVNPFRPEQITEALELVLTDETLRQNLIRAGYQRAQLFSWDKTAAEYLKLFQSLS
ncbi:MAG: glycosyltransferase family 1 protein [Patescibacteria group bacterium]